jgi:hypothetical protein
MGSDVIDPITICAAVWPVSLFNVPKRIGSVRQRVIANDLGYERIEVYWSPTEYCNQKGIRTPDARMRLLISSSSSILFFRYFYFN